MLSRLSYQPNFGMLKCRKREQFMHTNPSMKSIQERYEKLLSQPDITELKVRRAVVAEAKRLQNEGRHLSTKFPGSMFLYPQAVEDMNNLYRYCKWANKKREVPTAIEKAFKDLWGVIRFRDAVIQPLLSRVSFFR